MTLGKPPWTRDEHNQRDHLIDAEFNHIGKMKTPELAAQVVAAINGEQAQQESDDSLDEKALAAHLWNHLMVAWESREQEMLDVFRELVSNWRARK